MTNLKAYFGATALLLMTEKTAIKNENFAMNSRVFGRQERFIPILRASASILEAAERARVPVPTIYRWFKDPSFQTAHKQARQLMLNQTIQRLSALADSAVKALEEMVYDVGCSPHVKFTAVRLILENVVKIAESENFEQRVNWDALRANEPSLTPPNRI